jgi:hypothetical protein
VHGNPLFLCYHSYGDLALFRPGDNPNQCAQGYNCPPPSIALDPYIPFGNRYIDVGAGGPTPFTFTVSSSVPWLQLSTTMGSISPKSPEQRVFASVKDWSQLAAGANTATIKFTATAAKQQLLTVNVAFTATKPTVPSGFKGRYTPQSRSYLRSDFYVGIRVR